jgi:uncharacterized protein (TIGR02266 family)
MTQDTRRDRRVKIVSLNVRYKSATVDEFIENHAYDVSRGGIFIKTANPFPPGTLLKFEIRLASDQAVIAGVGRIVWKRDTGTATSEHPAGMGVKFIKIDEPSKAVIDRLVNTRADAGRAFEGSEEGQATEPAFFRSSPPGRPSLASTTPPPPGGGSMRAVGQTASPGPASIPPTGSVPATRSGGSASQGSIHASTPTSANTPFVRKATIMGMGVASPPPGPAARPASTPPPGSPAETGSTRPPPRPAFTVGPSVPPRPGGSPNMMFFPKALHDEGEPAKEDQTVMRQAAELLEDALREAGGSMSEIGQNPLFSGSGLGGSPTIPAGRGPVAPGAESTAADTPRALAATVAALRVEHAPAHAASDASDRSRSDAPQSGRPTLSSARPAAGEPYTSPEVSSRAPSAKKSGSGLLLVVIAAAAIAGAVVFRERLFGKGAPPEPVVAPSATTAPAVVAPPAASVTEVIAPPLASSPSSAPAVATPPVADSTETASSASAAPVVPAAPAPPTARPPMVYIPPRPRPAIHVAPPPGPPASASAPPSATGTAESAPAAPTATATSSTPPTRSDPAPASAKPRGDDNPY